MDANEILLEFLEHEPEAFRAWQDENRPRLPVPITPTQLLAFRPDADPGELIPRRYLCKGGSVLIAGPTGVGKSSFLMQFAIHATVKRDLFGMRFARPMKVVIVQAENDEGDLAESFQGVFFSLQAGGAGVEPLSAADIALIHANLVFFRETTRTGADFASLLREIAAQYHPDFILVDPAFSYLGADASSQKDVSLWLRNQINPVLMDTGVCLLLSHHTNKPLRGKDKKDTWQGTDFAYLGAGSAEWANWARAVIGLQRTQIPGIYLLTVAKRGGRLGWRDAEDKPTLDRFIAHAREPGKVYWREPDLAEVQSLNQKGAQEGYRRLPEVFKTDTEREAGLSPEEVMRRAKEIGITTSASDDALAVTRRRWITGKKASAIEHGILEFIGEHVRPVQREIPF